jgi:hypothetical protein
MARLEKTKLLRNSLIAVLMVTVAACGSDRGKAVGVTSEEAATMNDPALQPRAEDLDKSCSELDAELLAVTDRMEELNAQANSRSRTNGLLAGATGFGLGMLGAGVGVAGGSVNAIQNAGAVTQIAQGIAPGGVGDDEAIEEMTSLPALTQRGTDIQLAQFRKECR